jgi:hypothetical protein
MELSLMEVSLVYYSIRVVELAVAFVPTIL